MLHSSAKQLTSIVEEILQFCEVICVNEGIKNF